MKPFFFNLVAEEAYRFGLGFLFLLQIFEERQGRLLCCHTFRVKENRRRLCRTVRGFSLLALAEDSFEPAITASLKQVPSDPKWLQMNQLFGTVVF